jgi:hypothetical protein
MMPFSGFAGGRQHMSRLRLKAVVAVFSRFFNHPATLSRVAFLWVMKPQGDGMEELSNEFLGEHYTIVDKRDKQAVLRAILVLEQELTSDERRILRTTRQPLCKAVVRLEREYAALDTTLEQMSERFNKLIGEMRNVLAERNLLQAKNAVYDKIFEDEASSTNADIKSSHPGE